MMEEDQTEKLDLTEESLKWRKIWYRVFSRSYYYTDWIYNNILRRLERYEFNPSQKNKLRNFVKKVVPLFAAARLSYPVLEVDKEYTKYFYDENNDNILPPSTSFEEWRMIDIDGYTYTIEGKEVYVLIPHLYFVRSDGKKHIVTYSVTTRPST